MHRPCASVLMNHSTLRSDESFSCYMATYVSAWMAIIRCKMWMYADRSFPHFDMPHASWCFRQVIIRHSFVFNHGEAVICTRFLLLLNCIEYVAFIFLSCMHLYCFVLMLALYLGSSSCVRYSVGAANWCSFPTVLRVLDYVCQGLHHSFPKTKCSK